NLQYWVEDLSGTAIITWRSLLGKWSDATYAAVGSAQKTIGFPVCFARDIRPLFRQRDIDNMQGILDLTNYQVVKDNAIAINNALNWTTSNTYQPRMPCDGEWPPEWRAAFKQWMVDGYHP